MGISEPEKRFGQYPHEFSGSWAGVVIAIAIACNPQILICDEPTTALDDDPGQILDLIKELRHKYHLIRHPDYARSGRGRQYCGPCGRDVCGRHYRDRTGEDIFYDARHRIRGRASSLPQVGVKERLSPRYRDAAQLIYGDKGDAFVPRNPKALKIDFIKQPPYLTCHRPIRPRPGRRSTGTEGGTAFRG